MSSGDLGVWTLVYAMTVLVALMMETSFSKFFAKYIRNDTSAWIMTIFWPVEWPRRIIWVPFYRSVKKVLKASF